MKFIGRGFEFLRILVQAVVGEVHVHVALVRLVWLLVVGGAQPNDAFVTEVCLQGVDPPNEDIQPDVKFLLVDKEWIVHIFL